MSAFISPGDRILVAGWPSRYARERYLQGYAHLEQLAHHSDARQTF